MNPITFCIDMINSEPRYITELVRLYNKLHTPTDDVKDTIYNAVSYLIEEQGYEYISYDLEGGSINWSGYKLLYNPNHPSELYKKKIDKKLNKIKKLSEIGKKNAEMYENAIYRAIKEKYIDARKSAFNSTNPDIIIPSIKTLVEPSARFENPIDADYIINKIAKHKNKYKDYKIIFISPNITNAGLNEINMNKTMPCKWYKYPKGLESKAGFPVFPKYKYYTKTLEEVGRKGYLINPKALTTYIKKII